jgi:hypothetical protein
VEICRDNPNLVKIWQKYKALYIKTEERFIAAGDIKSTQKCSLAVKWYEAVRTAEEV